MIVRTFVVGLPGRFPSLRITSVLSDTTCCWFRCVFVDVSARSAVAVIPANALVSAGSVRLRRTFSGRTGAGSITPKTSAAGPVTGRRERLERRVPLGRVSAFGSALGPGVGMG